MIQSSPNPTASGKDQSSYERQTQETDPPGLQVE